ncbi:uncharacterized protein LOC141902129 [Tubulanus polymorphus]|uniref:uncharacterized protein LOC141902129 n=1 Tax=Tubulanus polymorphus TaxID=672921 RepID=UPI003DA628B3
MHVSHDFSVFREFPEISAFFGNSLKFQRFYFSDSAFQCFSFFSEVQEPSTSTVGAESDAVTPDEVSEPDKKLLKRLEELEKKVTHPARSVESALMQVFTVDYQRHVALWEFIVV